MLGIVKQDGQGNKYLSQIAGATLGQGVPLGAWCSFEKDVAPSSNWLVAGTTFDASVYPALNLYLGTNVVPSRYDHNRPSDEVTIDNFDTTYTTENTAYEVQNDGVMYFSAVGTNGNSTFINVYIKSKNSNSYKQICTAGTYGSAINYGSTTLNVQKGDKVYITAKNGGTTTTVYAQWYTHPLFIKATSIASDTDQQAILAQIQAYNTYSTEETLTGETWIDGKPIYRCVIPFQTKQTIGSSTSLTIGSALPSTIPFSNFDNITNFISGVIYRNNRNTIIPVAVQYNSATQIQVSSSDNYGDTDGIVLEYTKTTD